MVPLKPELNLSQKRALLIIFVLFLGSLPLFKGINHVTSPIHSFRIDFGNFIKGSKDGGTITRPNQTEYPYASFPKQEATILEQTDRLEFTPVNLNTTSLNLTRKIDDEHTNVTRYNVCGNQLDLLSSKVPCYNKTDVVKPKLITTCPWPKSVQSSERREYEFRNFSLPMARELLRGKTIIFNGDSTQRRLMWAFCHWISGDQSIFIPDDECCGTRRITFFCNTPRVTKLDILIGYTPGALKNAQMDAWVQHGILKILRFRSQEELKDYIKPIAKQIMPESKQSKAMHIFSHFLSWHVPNTCYLPMKGVFNFTRRHAQPNVNDNGCDYENLFKGSNETVNLAINSELDSIVESTCAIAANFCVRFTSSSMAAISEGTDSVVYEHGLTNVPAEVSRHNHDPYKFNWWQSELAKSAHSIQIGNERCIKYHRHLIALGAIKRNVNDSRPGFQLSCDSLTKQVGFSITLTIAKTKTHPQGMLTLRL